jgi:hypothetical protein
LNEEEIADVTVDIGKDGAWEGVLTPAKF